MWEFSHRFVPCFISGESSRVCSCSPWDSAPFQRLQLAVKSPVASRPLALQSREATGSEDSGHWGFQTSERRDVILAGLSATASHVLPYRDASRRQRLTQPFAHPGGPFAAVFPALPQPAEGCPPLLHLRLAFLPSQLVLPSPIQNSQLIPRAPFLERLFLKGS